jgi:hypothetical protein
MRFIMDVVSKVFICPKKNHYYSAVLGPDLFGNIVLSKDWGGSKKHGGHTIESYGSFDEGMSALDSLTKKLTRKHRGYFVV